MAITYEPIATTTLGSTASSVTFSSISGSYTDLVLITAAKYTTGSSHIRLQYNSDTGNNYSATAIYGDGAGAFSSRTSNTSSIAIARAGSEFGVGITHIQNYSNTTTYKTAIYRTSQDNDVFGRVGLWGNTAAINSIKYQIDSGNIQSGSTFTLYGIKSA